MDPNDLDSMYEFMAQNLQGRGIPTSDSMQQPLRHMSLSGGTTMEDIAASIGPVLDDPIDPTGSLIPGDVDDAMMEESIQQELRRQSLVGIPMGFMNYTGLGDSQGGLDMNLQQLNTAGLQMGNAYDSQMFLSPATTSAGPGLLDMTGYGDTFMNQMQQFGSTMQPHMPSRQNSMMDMMDTSVPLPAQGTVPPADDIGTLATQGTRQGSIPFNTMNIKMENIYSSSGFDMVGVLMRVATRANPKINIGAVDMSCAFVVCDARKFDMPIVYVSATFERLTGYTKHEILGRNCRFLQSPDGNVERGDKRKYVDEESVRYLKQQCEGLDEGQVSLINYRKGGQPFMNLLTTIPITWDSEEIVYIVGFQVDLVDHPGSIMNKNQDGTIQINYQHREPPSYYLQPPPESRQQAPGTTISKEDVSRVLQSLGSVDTDMARRLWDKILLENTDDVVHVLSLKGLFMYCSPSIQSVLEYDPSELVGTALSSVCHPSDIVPVTRDLKDTSTGSMVNIVFRIRRKYSGYVWFESHGSLHIEQGKGRKCIILVGRERPVYRLPWNGVKANGGIGENEMWTKVSTSGMFLFVPSHTKSLLDREPDELIGTSLQALMRPDSRAEVNKALDSTRTGKTATVRHELQNRRGQFLQAITTFYPDSEDGRRKPTFLIAQTKLVKHSRHSAGSTRGPASEAGSMTPKNPTPAWSGVTTVTSPIERPSDSSGERAISAENLKSSKDESGDDSDENLFDELKTTRSSSWQFELRQMQRTNKRLSEECASLLQMRKRRKRKKGADSLEKDCANCHTKNTPEWRRGPSGKRDLCNSCGLRYAKLVGRVSPRNTQGSSSHIGEVNSTPAANTDNLDGPSPRTDAPTIRTNSGQEPLSNTDENTSSSEHPTPGDAQSQGPVVSPAASGR